MNNIILIGFMATGKSSVGRLLAKELDWSFLDTDNEIEKITGLKISELFRKYGEIRFRSEENLLIKKMTGLTKTVISTGGGTVVNPENWTLLKQLGIMIHLYAPLDIVFSRVTKKQERPLLCKSNADIEELWKKRLNIYKQADITIDTSNKDLFQVVNEILEKVKGGSCL